jgi:hypothetical protein
VEKVARPFPSPESVPKYFCVIRYVHSIPFRKPALKELIGKYAAVLLPQYLGDLVDCRKSMRATLREAFSYMLAQ